MEILCLSSLEKVFFDGPTSEEEKRTGSALINETYGIQFAFYGSEKINYEVISSTQDKLDIFYVEQVPSMTPIKGKTDTHFLKGVPGFFPDLLRPIDKSGIVIGTKYQWHSVWIEIRPQGVVGQQDITIDFKINDDVQELSSIFSLKVIETPLPKQELIHTEWLHTDCLSDYYQVPIFSEHYWDLVKSYILFAKEHGQNMILTPLFSPPLDTEVGTYRPIVQLVSIEVMDNHYVFDFSNLTRWANICAEAGIDYLEMSHLFSQWGAEYAPHIVGTINQKEQTLFGWEIPSTSLAYQEFLKVFIPQLMRWIETSPYKEKVFFHLSDEPSEDSIDRYHVISKLVKELIGDYPILDALSNYSFYQKKLIDIPVVATDHISPFIDNEVTSLWAYYCSAQRDYVANRFFDMPSYRTRIIGYQLFFNNIKGFLHWGYNFWYIQYSKKLVNPFLETEAGGAFTSGDAYLVYPGKKSPLPSIRLKNMHYAMQDVQALEKLSELIGKDQVKQLFDSVEVTFSSYPDDDKWFLEKREQVNKLISQSI